MRLIAIWTSCSMLACSTASPGAGPVQAAARPLQSDAPAPAAPPPSRSYSSNEVAKLIYAESDNPVRACVSSAVRTQFALTAMKSGWATPQRVHDALVGSLQDPRLIARRERQFAEWKKEEDASKVATVLLEDCLHDEGIELTFAKMAASCFSYGSQPGVFALLGKKRGMSVHAAKDRERRLFGNSGLKEPLLVGIVDAVYEAPSGDLEFRVLEKLFGGCLSAMSGG